MPTVKRPTIAIILGDVQSGYSNDLVSGFYACAREENVNIIFLMGPQIPLYCMDILSCNFNGDYEYQFDTIYDYAHFVKPDAMIISYGSLTIFKTDYDKDEFISHFHDIPTLILEDIPNNTDIPYMIADNYNGMKLCIEHLVVDHGYQKIAYLSGPKGNRDAKERLNAYLDVMKEHHLPVTKDMISYGNYSDVVDSAVEFLLDHNEGLEAIAFANDSMAKAGYRVCGTRNLLVGHDIAITGFDDVDAAKTMEPPLTSVSHNSFLFSYQALQKALMLVNGEHVSSYRVPVIFHKRCSCGCPADTRYNPSLKIQDAQIRSSLSGTMAYPQQYVHSDDISTLQNEIMDYNRKSWFVPTFTGDLITHKSNPKEIILHIIDRLKLINVKSAYLFFYDEPILYHKEETITYPDKLNLIGFFTDSEKIYYDETKRPVVTYENGISSMLDQKNPHCYSSYVLFSGEEQFGILICEVEQEDIAFMQICSLQLGSLCRFIEMNKKERQIQQELENSLKLIQEQNRILSFVSEYDDLSKLLNRRGFMEKALRAIEDHSNQKACLLFGDLDHLKEINDCFGHTAGDFAIRTAADRLRNTLPESALIARIGGDEFVALVVTKEPNFKETLLQRIKEETTSFNEACDQPFYVEISVGLYEFYCNSQLDLMDLLGQSDAILYKEKAKRRKSIKK